MFISISDYIRKIGKIAAEGSEYSIKEIKIYFSAPNPKQADETSSLTIKDNAANDANFQWISFQALFTDKDDNYYVYSIPLESNGKGKPPDIVFDSDDDWSGKNKNTPSKKLTPGDVKKAYPEIFRGPNLFPAKVLESAIPTNYVNTDSSDKGNPYSSDEFKEEKNFNNDFYIVLDPKSKKLENPFGKHVEPKGKTYPETPEEGK